VKIKDARGPPLLSAPVRGREPWMDATADDLNAMSAELADCRKRKHISLQEIHLGLRAVGAPQEVTAADRKIILGMIPKAMREQDYFQVALIYADLSALGIKAKPTEAQRRMLLAELERNREEDGWSFTTMHYCLKSIGMQETITREDAGLMVKALESERKKAEEAVKNSSLTPEQLRKADPLWFTNPGDEPDVLMMHYLLKRLGHPQPVTEDDLRLMRWRMDFLRKDGGKDHGEAIAKTHHYLADVFPNTEATGQTPLPPLKRFLR
jgi:hypothetical protein